MKASVAIVDATGNGTGPDKKWNKNKWQSDAYKTVLNKWSVNVYML
jgi:hypothetical protein